MSNKLRVVRAEKRVTQFQLRLQTGINATKISFIENGLVNPTELEKRKLSMALEIPQEQVFPMEKKF